jgi:hypothetical protein
MNTPSIVSAILAVAVLTGTAAAIVTVVAELFRKVFGRGPSPVAWLRGMLAENKATAAARVPVPKRVRKPWSDKQKVFTVLAVAYVVVVLAASPWLGRVNVFLLLATPPFAAFVLTGMGAQDGDPHRCSRCGCHTPAASKTEATR